MSVRTRQDSNLRPPSCETDALTTRPPQLVILESGLHHMYSAIFRDDTELALQLFGNGFALDWSQDCNQLPNNYKANSVSPLKTLSYQMYMYMKSSTCDFHPSTFISGKQRKVTKKKHPLTAKERAKSSLCRDIPVEVESPQRPSRQHKVPPKGRGKKKVNSPNDPSSPPAKSVGQNSKQSKLIFGKTYLNINLSSARGKAGTSSEPDIYDFTDSPRSSDKEMSNKPSMSSKSKITKPIASRSQGIKSRVSVGVTPDLSNKNVTSKMKQLKIPSFDFLKRQTEANISASIPLITIESSSSDLETPQILKRQNSTPGREATTTSKSARDKEKCIVLSGDSDIVSDSDNAISKAPQVSHHVPKSDQNIPRIPRENVFERFSFAQTDQPVKNNTTNQNLDSIRQGTLQKQPNIGGNHTKSKRRVEVGVTSEESDGSSGYKERVPLFENLGNVLDTSVIPETPSASVQPSSHAAPPSKSIKITPTINLSGLSKLLKAKKSPFKKVGKQTSPRSAKRLKLSLKSRNKCSSPSKDSTDNPGSASVQILSGPNSQGNNIPVSPSRSRESRRTPTPTKKLQQYLASIKKRKTNVSPSKSVPQTIAEYDELITSSDIVSIPETQESDRTSSIPETQDPDSVVPETQEPGGVGSNMNTTPVQTLAQKHNASNSKKRQRQKSVEQKLKAIDTSTESDSNKQGQVISQKRKRKRSGNKPVPRGPSERKKGVPAKYKEFVVSELETAADDEKTNKPRAKFKSTPPLKFKRTPQNIKQSKVKKKMNLTCVSESELDLPLDLLADHRMTSTQKGAVRSSLLDSPPRVLESDESGDEGNYGQCLHCLSFCPVT